ncbi:MAG TPA: polymer-forming cytoskeletal protein [Bacteroidales bacterium]|nr:polymer-forming cytoskeletal protein [Bacteroidales bacterium]HPT02661.1 polymer-forming cytoskeletal protein [Bacteroidales bacterium]
MAITKPTLPETPSVNLLGSGTEINGDIRSNGDIRIDGSLNGTINCSGKVVIGSTGRIEGELICQNADISGEVKAGVRVAELLTLKATAVLCGDIITNKLAIEPGAVFTGTCKMESQNSVNGKTTDEAQTEPA